MPQRYITLPIILYAISSLTIALALVQVTQIPTNSLPPDSARLSATPLSHFTHALGGALFGLLGPLQFGRVLANRFGALHRILGRIFVLSGLAISVSSVGLLTTFWSDASPLVSGARLVFGLALGVSLILGVRAARRRDIKTHSAWMIRAYAFGMGATIIAPLFIPIYLATGTPPTGLFADLLFVGSWTAAICLAEWIIQRGTTKRSAAV